MLNHKRIMSEARSLLSEGFKYIFTKQDLPFFMGAATSRYMFPAILIYTEDGKPIKLSDKFVYVTAKETSIGKEIRTRWNNTRTDLMRFYIDPKISLQEIKDKIDLYLHDPVLKKMIKIEKMSRTDLYHAMTVDQKASLAIWDKYFGDKPALSADNEDFIDMYGAKVIFPKDVKETNKKSVIDTLELGLKAMTVAKMKKPIKDREIRIVRNLGKVLGFYNLKDKDMKVAYSIKKGYNAEHTIVHEMAHALFYEFLTQDERDKVKSEFSTRVYAAGNESHEQKMEKELLSKIKVGDKVKYTGRKHKDKEWSVVSVSPSFVELSTGSGIHTRGAPLFLLNGNWEFENKTINNIAMRYSKVDIKNIDSWTPTEYSKKNASEWFAELVALYVLKRLKGEPASFIKSFIK